MAKTPGGPSETWSGMSRPTTQLHTGEGANGYACQHALRAVLNVVLDVEACGSHISDQGARIADKMAATASPNPPPATFPTPPRAPMVAPDGLDPILLSVADVNTMMGTSGIQPDEPTVHTTVTSPETLSNPDCMGASFAAQTSVYQGSGYTAVASRVCATRQSPAAVSGRRR